jgi:hypothetical protein
MRMLRISTIAVGLLLLSVTLASAQATRTWVSGVGDDANPCSRTAPCKTFAGAISKTAAGGEINTLDSGGFGAVTITKSISIISEGNIGGILAAGTNGVIINGTGIHVVLRGLDINGAGTGLDGVRFLVGASLTIENCRIYGFMQEGIEVPNTAASLLFVKDSTISGNVGGGILSTVGLIGATLDNVRLERNGGFGGLRAEAGKVTIRNSVAAGNTNGINAASASIVTVDSSVLSSNTLAGLRASGAAAVLRVGNSAVTGNVTGVLASGGATIVSLGGNALSGNTTDGTFNSTLPRL